MRALVSVYDKTGLVDFVARLVASGVEVVSSGGTASALADAGIPVIKVADVTGAPEILGGRVKTLHPKIHGGILGRGAADLDEMTRHDIEPFEIVVANLYPFQQTVRSGAERQEIIEKIDIGGPAMVRAAAKNHDFVAIVTSPSQYDEVANALESGGISAEHRRALAAEAFFMTAAYDAAIVSWIGEDLVLPLNVEGQLRYGENPHQEAWLYRLEGASPWWSEAVQHQGKEMSFNNYADTEAAWRLAADLGDGSVVVVKHTNAAGAAVSDDPLDAFEAAWAGDPLAAFGGVVAINGDLVPAVAEALKDRFVEVVICRDIAGDALEALSVKKNVRVLTAPKPETSGVELRGIEGGFLAQERDSVSFGDWKVVSKRTPDEYEMEALEFAFTVAAHTKSNAIVIAKGSAAVGVGAGDQSRVGAAERAVVKAGQRAHGGVAASDAFFPFRDGLDTLAAAGVSAIVEPGGSRNDQEVIDAANEQGLSLVFTGERHFKH